MPALLSAQVASSYKPDSVVDAADPIGLADVLGLLADGTYHGFVLRKPGHNARLHNITP